VDFRIEAPEDGRATGAPGLRVVQTRTAGRVAAVSRED
jgi:hypothetical protein